MKKMVDLDILSGWGLTEMDTGSNASQLETSCKKTEGGYLINGNKRWIGNGNRDICFVWARDQEDKKVKCFIVDQKAKGVKYDKIMNKMGLRSVDNMQITYKDAFVPTSDKLEKAKDWMSGTNKVLKHSRIIVAWNAMGVLLGCYDSCIKYVT